MTSTCHVQVYGVTAIAKAGRTFLEKQLSFSGVLCARGRVLWSKAKEA